MSLSFPSDSLPWKDPETMPSSHLVLARIEHYSGAKPPRLVLARNTPHGAALSDGRGINHDWAVAGWIDHDFEIELLPVSAAAAKPRPLAWSDLASGRSYAEDGLGGTYFIAKSRSKYRLTLECELSTYLSVTPDADPRDVAEKHHQDRIRRMIVDAPD